jgi:DNA-binding beta-propeller fold protein YncE
MNGKPLQSLGAFGLVVIGILAATTSDRGVSAQGRAASAAPAYHVVHLWPRPFHDDAWVLGSITGVTVDAQNHVWVAHRGADSLENNEKGMALAQPSSSVCCTPAPPILEFDASGTLVASWGGPSQGYQWPQVPGGIAVDTKGNVWIAAAGLEPPPPAAGRGRGAAATAAAEAAELGIAPGGAARGAAGGAADATAGRGRGAAADAGAAQGARGAAAGRGPAPATGPAAAPAPVVPADAHVLKFSRAGRYLLTIGTPGRMDGADSQTTLNRPAAVAYDAAANEVFVADSGNHRVAVFDADSGAYKRHWFAYGEKTAGAAAGPYDPNAPPARSFRDVTCVEISKDGMVYVCDRTSNRIQVFDKSGKFLKEMVVAKDTRGATVALAGGATAVISAHGSVWDLAFSSDAQQRYLFVADGVNKKVRILQRDTLAEAGSFGSGGRYAGQFLAVNSIAADAQGNLYTGETHHGKRVQKFVPGR